MSTPTRSPGSCVGGLRRPNRTAAAAPGSGAHRGTRSGPPRQGRVVRGVGGAELRPLPKPAAPRRRLADAAAQSRVVARPHGARRRRPPRHGPRARGNPDASRGGRGRVDRDALPRGRRGRGSGHHGGRPVHRPPVAARLRAEARHAAFASEDTRFERASGLGRAGRLTSGGGRVATAVPLREQRVRRGQDPVGAGSAAR